MQPYHAIDDGRWVEQRIGPQRIKTTYAFRTLLDTEAPWPSAPTGPSHRWTPSRRIRGGPTRRTLDARIRGGWVPEQKIKRGEARRAYTYGMRGPRSTSRMGNAVAGRFADIVVTRSRSVCRAGPNRSAPSSHAFTVAAGKSFIGIP